MCFVIFFKQKTAYEMRISDWSSDVCSSDLLGNRVTRRHQDFTAHVAAFFNRSQLIFEVHSGSTRFDHGFHQFEGIQHSAKACRSEERRVGKESVSTCSSRWSQSH